MHTRFWLGNLKAREHLEYLGIDGRIILKLMLKKETGWAWTSLIWFRIVTSGRLL